MFSMRTIPTAGVAVLASAFACNAANAACATLAGTWYIFDMRVVSPSIQSTPQTVVVGPTTGDVKNINVFKSAGSFNNRDATAMRCTLTVQVSGATSASCVGYETVSATKVVTQSETGTGTLALNACNLSGRITMSGVPFDLIIRGGHINGNMGGGVATLAGEVNTFVIVRK